MEWLTLSSVHYTIGREQLPGVFFTTRFVYMFSGVGGIVPRELGKDHVCFAVTSLDALLIAFKLTRFTSLPIQY
jgi:hypothetical protein